MAKTKITTINPPQSLTKVRYLLAELNGQPEINTLPSQTIPNQAMSLQDMVNKFTITSEWPKTLPEQYDTPESLGLPDITQMDKIQIQELANKTQADIQKHQAALQLLQEEEFTKVQEQNALLKQQMIDLNKQDQNPNS